MEKEYKDQIRSELQRADWNDLGLRLYYYTLKCLRNKYWRGEPRGPIPGGREPIDFIHDAVDKLLAGKRLCPKEITLFQCLAGIIRSDISHLAVSMENCKEERLIPELIEEYQEESDLLGNSDDTLMLDEIRDLLKDDPHESAIFEILLSEGDEAYSKNKYLSTKLNISVENIVNAKRRLERSLQNYPAKEKRISPLRTDLRLKGVKDNAKSQATG